MRPDEVEIRHRKDTLRETLMAARRARPEAERRAARNANSEHLRVALAGLGCVAAYLPLPSEPLDAGLLDHLAGTSRVLVPVAVGPEPLDWCRHPGPVRRGALGIDEPMGERLGPNVIASTDAVLVPALAVDHRGYRLGRGGGHYDRTLALLDSLRDRGIADVLLIAVLYDGEVLQTVPSDALDRPVSAVVTPATGLTRLT